VPADEREPYDVREVIARLVDGSDFLEFKAEYAAEMMCGHARLQGRLVGILGNNGPIQPSRLHQGGAVHPAVRPERHASDLSAEHHGLHGRLRGRAQRRHQAWLQDDPGRGQCPRAQVHHSCSAAPMARATTACADAVSIRASSSAWPTARTAVMGGAQAAKVMDIVNRAKIERTGMDRQRRSAGRHV
jgi:geranyl-CoA carboxylase beta subunit